MKTQKGISTLWGIIILLIVAGGAYYFISNNFLQQAENNYEYGEVVGKSQSDSTEQEAIQEQAVSESETQIIVNTSTDSDDLWEVFDKVVLSLKNKDIASYNMYSYIQVESGEEAQFESMIPFLSGMMSAVNKNNYVNRWQDDKQAIFSTNSVQTADGYNVEQVGFIKEDGSWKLLVVSNSGFASTATFDSDKDGLTDSEETCTANHDPSCVKTDPNKRDTDGDGWWDGIEINMNRF